MTISTISTLFLREHEETSYAIGRVCAVTTGPLCLFVANNYLAQQAAVGLAVTLLASNVAMAAIAADVHRRFYLRHFAPDRSINGLGFYVYAMSLSLLGSLGCAIVLAIVLYFTHSLLLGAASIVYFVSEKLADEMLRLRLFERDLRRWGRSSIACSALHIGGLGLVLFFAGSATPAFLAVLILASGTFVVFIPQLPAGLGHNLGGRTFRTVAWLARRAVNSVRGDWILWAIALLSAGAGYMDRLGALVLDKTTLPLFMLVVMCFSVLQMAVDFFYVSRYRRDFLEQRISVLDAVTSREFRLSVGAGLALAGTACLVVLRFSRNGAQFPFGYVLAIAALQISFAGVMIPQQILYWKHHLGLIFSIEIAYWALFACAVFSTWFFQLSLSGILTLVVACAVARLAMYFSATRAEVL